MVEGQRLRFPFCAEETILAPVSDYDLLLTKLTTHGLGLFCRDARHEHGTPLIVRTRVLTPCPRRVHEAEACLPQPMLQIAASEVLLLRIHVRPLRRDDCERPS